MAEKSQKNCSVSELLKVTTTLVLLNVNDSLDDDGHNFQNTILLACKYWNDIYLKDCRNGSPRVHGQLDLRLEILDKLWNDK